MNSPEGFAESRFSIRERAHRRYRLAHIPAPGKQGYVAPLRLILSRHIILSQ